eukprot:g9299.t1
MIFRGDDGNPQDQKPVITYETCFRYVEELEKWLSCGIQPSNFLFEEDRNIVYMEEQELYSEAVIELEKRCQSVRRHLWSLMPDPPLDQHLVVKPSLLGGNSGLGLFASKSIKKNDLVCLYTGQIHSLKSSTRLEDRSYLNKVSDNLFVDPKPCPKIKARYVNDCINPKGYNCCYQRNLEKLCVEVRALRDIHENEELFVSYGNQYWDQSNFSPIVLTDEKLESILEKIFD